MCAYRTKGSYAVSSETLVSRRLVKKFAERQRAIKADPIADLMRQTLIKAVKESGQLTRKGGMIRVARKGKG